MFETLGRSWDVTKATFAVMKADKELFIFPILSAVFGLLFLIAMIVPSVLLIVSGQTLGTDLMVWVALFGIYFGLAFITTFFSVATVYTAKERFNGNDATLKTSMSFAFSRLPRIAAWALLSATVGILLRMLESMASKTQGGRMVMGIITSLLGAAWAVLTLFVIPVIVYENVGPIDAIKRSVAVLKKTWGESLVKWIGVAAFRGIINMIFVVGLILAFVIMMMTGQMVVALIIAAVCVLGFIANALVFSIAEQVYDAALYVYATTGKIPSGFTQQQLASAVQSTK